MNLHNTDGHFFKIFDAVYEILILHFLWLICSLPIVTIGASSTALYYACMKSISKNDGYITKNFFKSFKENFKQSTIIWLILLVVGLIFFADFRFCNQLNNSMGKILMICCSVLLIPYILILVYIFPVQAKLENPIKINLKNALLMAVSCLPQTILILLVPAAYAVLSVYFLIFIGVLVICGAGLYGYLTSLVFVKVFAKFFPEDNSDSSGVPSQK